MWSRSSCVPRTQTNSQTISGRKRPRVVRRSAGARWHIMGTDRSIALVARTVMALGCLSVPTHAHASDLDLTVVLEGGAPWTHARSQYELYFMPPSEDPRQPDVTTTWGTGGAAQVVLTGGVHSLVRLGGVFRVGVFRGPVNAFRSDTQRQISLAMGPALRFGASDAERGFYGGLWAGFSANPSYGFGWGASVDAGYRFLLHEHWSLGVGAALTTESVYSQDKADHGRYKYVYRTVWPALQLRVSHHLL